MTTYSAVVTTGIYCRPGCAARPLARNVQTFDHPAEAEAAGFRACYRCRPYRVAAPVTTNAPELVCEAVQQIIGGVMDDGGTEAMLAARIGMSARNLRRLFLRHLGVSPDQLARSRRGQAGRQLRVRAQPYRGDHRPGHMEFGEVDTRSVALHRIPLAGRLVHPRLKKGTHLRDEGHQARELTKTLGILDAEGADGAFV